VLAVALAGRAGAAPALVGHLDLVARAFEGAGLDRPYPARLKLGPRASDVQLQRPLGGADLGLGLAALGLGGVSGD